MDFFPSLFRYHKACYVQFVNPKTFKVLSDNDEDSIENAVIDAVIKEILSNQEKIWNSVEIYEVYLAYGGQQHLSSTKNRLMNRMSEILKEKVYLFKSTGVATILMHKQKATALFQVVLNVEEDNNIQVDTVTNKIKKEIKTLPKLKDSYPPLYENSIWQSCSETLLLLLAKISPITFKVVVCLHCY